ncbi:hypothetical protein [Micromonospora sp. RTP1Z1]|uniref:hypothetical protein n=1 Tax=Micromonospora sp. RTP1Z1 TaxID=2994043 RepID=UPI0029C8F249|nr:hypothetical protein [Micromonospora sp. RTP1Z1]
MKPPISTSSAAARLNGASRTAGTDGGLREQDQMDGDHHEVAQAEDHSRLVEGVRHPTVATRNPAIPAKSSSFCECGTPGCCNPER